jgi:hypothetical protein
VTDDMVIATPGTIAVSANGESFLSAFSLPLSLATWRLVSYQTGKVGCAKNVRRKWCMHKRRYAETHNAMHVIGLHGDLRCTACSRFQFLTFAFSRYREV